MMSAFFILILGKFFLKYEGRSNCVSPQKKLLSKSPALLGLISLLDACILIRFIFDKKKKVAGERGSVRLFGTCELLLNFLEKKNW